MIGGTLLDWRDPFRWGSDRLTSDSGSLGAVVELPSELLLELVDVVGLSAGDGLPEVIVGSEDSVPADADPSRGDRGVEGRPPENGGLEKLGWRAEEELHVSAAAELRDPGVEFG